MSDLNFPVGDASARRRATAWLLLAAAAAGSAGMFAILMVLARVPALGTLFDGSDFYHAALTLHVNLSQWVWFLAFAGMLWSLSARRTPAIWDWSAFVMACAGALVIAIAPLFGPMRPVTSNYLPILDSRPFLSGLIACGIAVTLKAALAMCDGTVAREPQERAIRVALVLSASTILVALVLFVWSHVMAAKIDSRHDYFEALFWGCGHVWMFSATLLMMLCWSSLAAGRTPISSGRGMALLYGLGATPALAALVFPFFVTPPEDAYFDIFTWQMRWTSWEIPSIVAGLLVYRSWRDKAVLPTGIGLSVLLFAVGLLFGSAIGGQTTLIAAHYHGTVGAVTLAFMAFSYRILPQLGAVDSREGPVRLQLRLYGWGNLVMMLGLAGAGFAGAPRKIPGNLALELNVETFSRLFLGLGGTLATVGILMFAFLTASRLRPFPTVAKAFSS